jgi:conjugative relaxase-like TrwC/TraI family protein
MLANPLARRPTPLNVLFGNPPSIRRALLVHASISKIQARDTRGIRNVAVYITTPLRAQMSTLTIDDLEEIASYFVGGEQSEQGQIVESVARWFGGSCAALGLKEGETATTEAVQRLLQQLHPEDATKLPNNGGRRAAVQALDLTFALEKDLSILAMVGGASTTEALLAIQDEAVSEALRFLERQAAVVRRGKDGLVHKDAAGLLAVGADHITARPVDGKVAPHLHRHMLIFNLAQGPDGAAWTALDAGRLFDLQALAGAIAGQRVRELTAKRFGLHWHLEHNDGKGIWRVSGIDDELRRSMSTRQWQVLDEALERGLDTSDRDQWATAQRISREGKKGCGAGDESEWAWALQKLADAGVTESTLRESTYLAAARAHQAVLDRQLLDEEIGVCPWGYEPKNMWRGQAALLLGRGISAVTPGDPSMSDRIDAALEVDTRTGEELRQAICLGVGRARSTWRRHDLLAALIHGADISLVQAEAVADRFLTEHAVKLAGVEDHLYPDGQRVRTADSPLYATTETLDKERLLLQAAKDGVGAASPLVSEEQMTEVLARLAARGKTIESHSEQYQMVEAILRGKNRFVLIQGQQGAGKSAGLEALNLAGQITGTQVFGGCLAANAARNLKTESGIESYSLAMLVSRLTSGQIQLRPRAIIVVDECSQTSTEQLHALWTHLDKVGGRLMGAGDERQLQSIQAGGLFRTIQARVPDVVVRLDETRRQIDPEERGVLAFIHDRGELTKSTISGLKRGGTSEEFIKALEYGGYRAVLDWYRGRERVHVHESLTDAAAVMAKEYWDAVQREGATSVMLARTNDQCCVLNRAAIDEAVTRGHLTGETVIDFAAHDWLVGQRVVGRKVDRDLEILNGQSGTVTGIREIPSSYEVVVIWPGDKKRTYRHSTAPEGEALKLELSAVQVAREKELAETAHHKAQTALANAERRRATAGTGGRRAQGENAVARAKANLSAASKRWSWAAGLPDEGATVLLPVLSCRAGEPERRLVVALDEGGERTLPEAYVRKDLESGYAVSIRRGQGITVDHGIELGASYVGLSRGRAVNSAHIVVDTSEIKKTAAEERELLQRVAAHLGKGADEKLAEMEQNLAAHRQASGISQKIGGVEVTMTADAELLRARSTEQLVRAWIAFEHDPTAPSTLGVARTSAQVADLNDAIVWRLAGAKKLFDLRRIAGTTWAPLMPVVIQRDAKRLGLSANDRGFVVGYEPERGLVIEMDDGRQITFSEAQVDRNLSPAWVVTAARARGEDGLRADKIIAVGHGLSDEDLTSIRGHSKEQEILVEAPDLAVERTTKMLADETMLEDLSKDATITQRAAVELEQQMQTMGLASLQEERRLLHDQLVDVEKRVAMEPDELARRIIEDRLIAERRRREEILRSRRESEKSEGLADAQVAIDRRIEEHMRRLRVLTSRQAFLDPEAEAGRQSERAEIIAGSEVAERERLTGLSLQLDELDEKLEHWVEIAVARDMAQAPKYIKVLAERLEEAVLAVDDPAEQVRMFVEEVEAVERYRLRWRVAEQSTPLGPEPEPGTREAGEFNSLVQHYGEELMPKPKEDRRERERAEEIRQAPEEVSFRRVGDDYVLRGPVEEMRIGPVTVRRTDGSVTTIEVVELGKPFMLHDKECVHARFVADWCAARDTPTQDDHGRSGDGAEYDEEECPEQRRAYARQKALEEHRRIAAEREALLAKVQRQAPELLLVA